MAQSLFRACKNVIRNGAGSVQNVGGYDVGIEYYTQEDIDENVRKIKFGEASKCTFGDSDESKVVLVASPEITIPAGFTLTPVSPKKSLVIICNTLINNGIISMTAKAPYTLPHDWNIVGQMDGYDENVVIPAYANNEVKNINPITGTKHGNNGISRQCGSGGGGNWGYFTGTTPRSINLGNSGSGYSFGGGSGTGGVSGGFNLANYDFSSTCGVSATYPMRGGDAATNAYWPNFGGVGNPAGTNSTGKSATLTSQATGCGGRIIVFCNELSGSGNIQSNGSNSRAYSTSGDAVGLGGASGGGAIDLFYTTYTNTLAFSVIGGAGASGKSRKSGNGGNGCITYSDGDQAPLWVMPDVFKPRRKKFTKDNWTYLFGEYVDRLNQEV